jgi:hypothetical protein
MKTKAFILILLAFSSTTIFGQTGGIKGGANFANFYTEDINDVNLKLGLNLGLWHQSADGHFQTELTFSNKGSEVVDNDLFGTGRYRYNFNYLEVPLLFVGHVENLNIHFGPYFGFLVGANIKKIDSNGSVNSITTLDRDDFNALDYGLSGGIGIDFDESQIGLRYNYGLREVGKSGASFGGAGNNAKNAALQLYVGFKF